MHTHRRITHKLDINDFIFYVKFEGDSHVFVYKNHYENTPIQIYRKFHLQKLNILR